MTTFFSTSTVVSTSTVFVVYGESVLKNGAAAVIFTIVDPSFEIHNGKPARAHSTTYYHNDSVDSNDSDYERARKYSPLCARISELLSPIPNLYRIWITQQIVILELREDSLVDRAKSIGLSALQTALKDYGVSLESEDCGHMSLESMPDIFFY